ncbi:MAG: hypothetical protein GY781_15005 [Gammaproteobacteria bacterium]|nr:hypothetical protein [Gammaproteobacteria bacterium]
MALSIRKRKCLNCHKLFRPDSRNQSKQEYCSKSACRKASKAASQQRWLGKEENRDYFKGADNVNRVQEWRKKNPGYSSRGNNALQDHSIVKTSVDQRDAAKLTEPALQDLLAVQTAVLVGLIATFTGDTLQDHIASTTRNMQQLGNDILQSSTHIFEGGNHDKKAGNSPRPDT